MLGMKNLENQQRCQNWIQFNLLVLLLADDSGSKPTCVTPLHALC